MIVVDVDSASLARFRLVPSPAQELVSWLRLTANRLRHPVYGDPGATARSALFDRDVALTARVLTANGYVPDLLTPKPTVGSTTLDEQLSMVAETPTEDVVFQVNAHRSRANRPHASVRAAAESGDFTRRAARGMAVFWRAAVQDGWTMLRSTLEADMDRRSRVLGQDGIGRLLNSLHPTMRWRAGRIEVFKPYALHTRVTDAEVVLAPSAVGWPHLSAQLIDPADIVLSYPAREVGGPPAGPTTGPAGLDRLVGSSRARLLSHLDDPRSTTELSVRTGLAPATVSHHLTVLMRSGLLVRQRDGRSVLYCRNQQADLLLGLGEARRAATGASRLRARRSG